ncbi:MAG: ribbon-helix-helix domain-containing protein [Actinomycetota bacterium]|jgi:predicted transcriptional regulator|nr:ribbon-helix-helix domain-containing protein [Actinomycetota bacterium]
MKRTTIMADEVTVDRLRRLAGQRGVSFAQVVREALEDKAETFAPAPTSLGAGASSHGPRDAARTEASDRQPPRTWR